MKQYVVDAFTDKVFSGNPAAVCIMDEWLPDDLMLKIAMENNLSETAFAVNEGDRYRLRWFTPGGEMCIRDRNIPRPDCGHCQCRRRYRNPAQQSQNLRQSYHLRAAPTGSFPRRQTRPTAHRRLPVSAGLFAPDRSGLKNKTAGCRHRCV